jgi:hypothetical protein
MMEAFRWNELRFKNDKFEGQNSPRIPSSPGATPFIPAAFAADDMVQE